MNTFLILLVLGVVVALGVVLLMRGGNGVGVIGKKGALASAFGGADGGGLGRALDDPSGER